MEEILHQLKLVVYPIIYKVLAPSQVVIWDFWTINSMSILFVPCTPVVISKLLGSCHHQPSTTTMQDMWSTIWRGRSWPVPLGKRGDGPAQRFGMPIRKKTSTTSGQNQAYFLQANFPPKDVWLIFEYFQCLIFDVLTTPCCRVASGCFAPAFLAIQRNSNCLVNVQISRICEKISWCMCSGWWELLHQP